MSLWTDLLGAEIRFVDAGRTRTRVLTMGTGPPVLALHGRGGHLETFCRNIPALAERHTVIAADLLGHGLTDAVGEDFSVPRLAGHVAALMDALGLGAPAVLGQSLGGWVAAHLAIEQPERVGRLVLVEPAGLQTEEERQADPRVRAAAEAGGRAFQEPTLDAVRDRFAGLVRDLSVVDDELVRVRQELYRPASARAVHLAVRAADNGAVVLTPQRLAEITAPTLLVHGEHGHLPAEVVRAAARAIPRCRAVIVESTKQWPQYENPAVVNAEIIQFLEES
jgi:2-hydroxy-6-oxonona-2,4-dienedioate hydrolase